MTDASLSKNPQSFLNNTSLTKDLAFSLQSPFYTMFTHTKNDKLLDNFKSNGELEDDFKVQNIVIYAGFRLTQILQHGMDYARVVHVEESMRRLTWIQTGLLHELRYFLGYIGLAAASGWSHKLDIPPIVTYLSSAFGIASKEDLPVSIDDRLFDHTIFCAWLTQNVEWVDAWWMDADFNIDRPLDPLNKTTFISDNNLFDAMAQFWESYAAFKMAEHAALTEGDYPHTSRRSQWKMPQRPDVGTTCLAADWDNWNDLYVGVRGRRWASTNPAEGPAPGIDILGCMDNVYNREETRRRYEGLDIESRLLHMRNSLARDGQDVESPYSSPADGLHPDQTRMESLAPIINKPISLAGARRPLPAPDPVTERPTESLSAWRSASGVRQAQKPSINSSRMHNKQLTGSAKVLASKIVEKPNERPVTSKEPNWANAVQYGPERLKKIMDDIDPTDDDDDDDMEDDDTDSDGGLAALASSMPAHVGTADTPIVLDDDDEESDGGLASALAVTKMSQKPALAAAVKGVSRKDDESEEEDDDNSFAEALVQVTNRAAGPPVIQEDVEMALLDKGKDKAADGGDDEEQDDDDDDEEEDEDDEEEDGFANALLGK